MKTQGMRWWIVVLSAPFAMFALLVWWVRLLGPEELGFELNRDYQIELVAPESAAARAGLLAGDRLLTWDGEPVRGRLASRLQMVEIGHPWRLEVEREGARVVIEMMLGRRPLRDWASREGLDLLVTLLAASLNISLAIFLAWRRPQDPVALVCAAFLAVIGTGLLLMSPNLPYASGHALRQLPVPLGVLLLLPPILSTSVSAELMLSFACVFPRRVIRRRWIWLLLWSPVLVRLSVIGPGIASSVFPALARPWIIYPRAVIVLLMSLRLVYMAAFLAILFWSYRQLEDRTQRRRLRVVVAGLAVSLLPLLPLLLTVANWDWLRQPLRAWRSSPLSVLSNALFVVGPMAMAYAILRHRIFDVRLIVRRGIQYAAARGLLLSLVPICGALLLADLALHREQTLGIILGERGWLYLCLGAVGLVLHRRQQSWLTALDRQFFRERYDAQRLLGGVVEEIRQAHDFATAAPRIARQIAAALHPEVVALLVRLPGAAQFRPAAVAPSETGADALPALTAESKLLAVLRLLGKPVEISPGGSGWLQRQLPPDEADLLRQSRLEWLFPIAFASGATEALLVLGRKLSEEPYSEEDQDLLAAISTSLALLLERPATPAPPPATAEHIPASAGSDLLAGRYHLGQLLGQGGMGSVLEAVDATLERRVAVKLMRVELLQDPEAVARFKREARAAAGFTHPNVVTVHDFGVAEDRRAYLVMERLEGETLRAELRRAGRLTPPRVVEILRAVAAAVDAAHERHLVHRDLKPENVFLAQLGGVEVPKVLDFGIAKSLVEPAGTLTSGGTAPGLLLGTPSYMSPGQLQGGEPVPAWDLWSLSVVAYEALTGAYPFPPPFTAEGLRAILSGQVAPTLPYLGEAAAPWDALFGRVLSADPAARPDSARRLVADLAAVAFGGVSTEQIGLATPPS